MALIAPGPVNLAMTKVAARCEEAAELLDFEALYRQHHGTIWRFLVHLGVREGDVADVTHNVFLTAYRKLGDFEHRSSLRTWLCGIAWRVGRDFMRSASVRLEVASSDARADDEPESWDWTDGVLHEHRLTIAMRLLATLPADQREVFVLHELDQMTGPEIAQIMGTPVATVRSRLKRARDSFRARLTELKQRGALDL